tara:strand:- start:750 stop:938 length:189 start_codon:yes stop_codon:yes gene_type:complete
MLNDIDFMNDAFFDWACDRITNAAFHDILATQHLIVDLRQADVDNTLVCWNTLTDQRVILEC